MNFLGTYTVLVSLGFSNKNAINWVPSETLISPSLEAGSPSQGGGRLGAHLLFHRPCLLTLSSCGGRGEAGPGVALVRALTSFMRSPSSQPSHPQSPPLWNYHTGG